jgi:excisionase family DNA binding protein
MSGGADRVALEGLRLLVREWIREILAEERPATPGAAEGFIEPAEAGRRIGVKAAAVRKAIKEGRIPAVKLPGHRGWKIKPSDLAALVAGASSTDALPLHSPPLDFTQERARRLAASVPRGQKP